MDENKEIKTRRFTRAHEQGEADIFIKANGSKILEVEYIRTKGYISENVLDHAIKTAIGVIKNDQ